MSIPITFRLGSIFTEEDDLRIGEGVWDNSDARYHRFGVGSGEKGPRYYPGVDKYGNLRMNFGTSIRVPLYGQAEAVFGVENDNFIVRLRGKTIMQINTMGLQVAGAITQTNTGNPTFLPSDSGLAELLFPLFNDKTMIAQFNRPAFMGIDANNKFRVQRTPPNFLSDFNSTMARTQANVGPIYQAVNGAYVKALANEMRITYSGATRKCRGFLVEPASSNLILNSYLLNTWQTQTNLTLTYQNVVPWTSKGLNAPWSFNEGNVTGEHSNTQPFSANPTLPIALSFYYQAQTFTGTRRFTVFAADPSRTNLFGINFDAVSQGAPVFSTNRTAGAGAVLGYEVENVGGGIYRVMIYGTINTGGTNANTALNLTLASLGDTAGNSTLGFLAGNGTGNWCYVGDFQVEQSGYPYATSYMANGAAFSSRGADTFSLNLANFRFSPLDGSFEVRFKARSQVAVGANVASLQDTAGTTRLDYYISAIDLVGGNYTIGVKTFTAGTQTNTQANFATVSIAKSILIIAYTNLTFTPTKFVLSGANGFSGHYSLISYE